MEPIRRRFAVEDQHLRSDLDHPTSQIPKNEAVLSRLLREFLLQLAKTAVPGYEMSSVQVKP